VIGGGDKTSRWPTGERQPGGPWAPLGGERQDAAAKTLGPRLTQLPSGTRAGACSAPFVPSGVASVRPLSCAGSVLLCCSAAVLLHAGRACQWAAVAHYTQKALALELCCCRARRWLVAAARHTRPRRSCSLSRMQHCSSLHLWAPPLCAPGKPSRPSWKTGEVATVFLEQISAHTLAQAVSQCPGEWLQCAREAAKWEAEKWNV